MVQGNNLLRHGDFVKHWIGQTISLFGSQFTLLALPLVAILMLAAGPAEMGLLVALETAPFLMLGLFVGVWVDRYPRRPVRRLPSWPPPPGQAWSARRRRGNWAGLTMYLRSLLDSRAVTSERPARTPVG